MLEALASVGEDWRDVIYFPSAAGKVADRTIEFYKYWKPPKPLDDSLLDIYAPSLLQSKSKRFLRDRYPRTEPSSNSALAQAYQKWVDEILHLCLFVDRLWVPDPAEILARDILGREGIAHKIAIHEPLLLSPQKAYLALSALFQLEPLVDAGTIVYYPPLNVYEREVALPLFGSVRYFTEQELETAWPKTFVAEGLHFAASFGASYAALAREEFRALQEATVEIGKQLGITNARVIAALPRLQLPFFDNANPDLLARVRADEEALEDFRVVLRKFARKLVAGVEDPDFADEVSRIEHEFLQPAIQKLLDDVRGVSVLRDRLSEAGIDIVVGILAGVLSGDPLAAMATGGLSALARALVKGFIQHDRLPASSRLVYTFHSGRAPEHGIDPN